MNEVLWDEDFDVEWYHVTETTQPADILWGIRDAC